MSNHPAGAILERGRAAGAAGKAIRHTPHKILVVDDEDGMRTFLFTILTHAGYDVVTAEGVHVGSRVMDEASPDLLITDVRLGKYNGLQLLAMNPRAVPAIVMTGYPDPVLEADARQLGAQFLLKPIEPAGLLTLVADLLENRPRSAV
jgi:DNA-binding NtrC family response regulator